MPYLSEAQRRFFHTATAREKGITPDEVSEFDAASKGKKLPARAKTAYQAGVDAALRLYAKTAAGFAAPPALGSAAKTPSIPTLPKLPTTPKPPEPLAHAANDLNTSMSCSDRRLNSGPVQPATR